MENNIFHPDHLERLRSQNLVRPGSTPATLLVSREGLCLCNTTDELEIPIELESAATLVFCGLNHDTATVIFDR